MDAGLMETVTDPNIQRPTVLQAKACFFRLFSWTASPAEVGVSPLPHKFKRRRGLVDLPPFVRYARCDRNPERERE